MNSKDIAKAWYSAVDARDFATLEGLLDADHEFVSPRSATPVGADQHLENLRMWTAGMDGEHELLQTIAEGNRVAVLGRWTGKHSREFYGMAPTGNPVTFTFAEIMEIEGGRIRRQHLEANMGAVMAQITAAKAA
jgi:predicted ester cyclase